MRRPPLIFGWVGAFFVLRKVGSNGKINLSGPANPGRVRGLDRLQGVDMVKPILSCLSPERVAARIMSRISIVQNCWLWTGPLDRWGYGKIRIPTPDGTRATGTHRAAWLSMNGDIASQELQIDHLRRNRACVNPAHMELVTNAINSLRSDHSRKSGRSGRIAGSPPGCRLHGTSYGRSAVGKDGYTRWHCQTCATERVRKHLAKKRLQRSGITSQPSQ